MTRLLINCCGRRRCLSRPSGSAVAIVTNDKHLLDVDPYGMLRIVRPTEFVSRWLDSSRQT